MAAALEVERDHGWPRLGFGIAENCRDEVGDVDGCLESTQAEVA